jgi:HEAT repeat protein
MSSKAGRIAKVFALLAILLFPAVVRADDKVEPLGVRRIWDQAPHNAFTSLLRLQDRWVCAFREAPAHVGPTVDGKMRVISSTDADHWESAVLLEDKRGDIRDAKLSMMPDGRLMLLTATHVRGAPARHQSIAWYTKDLKSWEGPVDVGESNIWLWGLRWHKGVGYSIGYSTSADHFVRLYKTTDGRHFEKLVDRLDVPTKFPNESAIVFDGQDVAHVLLRSDSGNACIGQASVPYTDWSWKEANARVGGPALMLTPSGRLLGGGRLYDGKVRTSLFWVDPQNATFTECLTLPSGGDTSYPGLVLFDGTLYVSYYSSHENKTAIYLAKCRLPSEHAAVFEGPTTILVGALERRGEVTSIHAAEDLIELGQSEAARVAFEPQVEESRQPYRILVWRVLARCAKGVERRAKFVEKIRSALLDPASGDRVHAMEALVKLGADISDAERPLVTRKAEGSDPDAPFAAWWLAEGGDEKAGQRLVTMLSSDDPVIRARAADALGHLGIKTPEIRDALTAALGRESSSSPARPLIIVALGGPAVRDLLSDPSPLARYRAATSLARIGDVHDVELLKRLLRDADMDVRAAAAFATLRIEQRMSSGDGHQADIDIGSRRELFVDRYLIDRITGAASLRLHRPIDRGPVLQFDSPWEGAFSAYVTILHAAPDKYQMYYRGTRGGGDTDDRQVTCYAESSDGMRWTKPQLDLFPVPSYARTNIVLAHAASVTHNFCPFIDNRPGVNPDERYKAIGGYYEAGLFAYVSGDGIHWRKLADSAVLTHEQVSKSFVFDSQNVAFWSEVEGKYLLFYRVYQDKKRRIARVESDDFLHWNRPTLMDYRRADGTPALIEELYTNQTQPYFRAPHLYIATAARFMLGRQAITTQQAESIHVDPKYFHDVSDAIFMTSRGGNVYDRTFMEAFVAPEIGAENWTSRTNYPALNVVQTGPAEMSLYVNQSYAQPTAQVRRYSLRLDGFTSVRGDYDGGEMVTRPLRFIGNELVLNFATSAAGSVLVEVQDEAGRPVPGFTLQDCRELIGNDIERPVTWANVKLADLAGKPIRLRFSLKDADLYAMQFRADPD